MFTNFIRTDAIPLSQHFSCSYELRKFCYVSHYFTLVCTLCCTNLLLLLLYDGYINYITGTEDGTFKMRYR